MAETLTYDGTEADAPELTPEEQDSLAVGEKMMADQEELLAGKYRSAQDLEKAYLELQKKLGEGEKQTQQKLKVKSLVASLRLRLLLLWS